MSGSSHPLWARSSLLRGLAQPVSLNVEGDSGDKWGGCGTRHVRQLLHPGAQNRQPWKNPLSWGLTFLPPLHCYCIFVIVFWGQAVSATCFLSGSFSLSPFPVFSFFLCLLLPLQQGGPDQGVSWPHKLCVTHPSKEGWDAPSCLSVPPRPRGSYRCPLFSHVRKLP